VILLPPLVPTPAEAADGAVRMRGCARAGVHTGRRACALPLPRQQLALKPVTILPFAFFIIIIFRLYSMLENPALMIRKFKFLWHFAFASYFLDSSSSNVAFHVTLALG